MQTNVISKVEVIDEKMRLDFAMEMEFKKQ